MMDEELQFSESSEAASWLSERVVGFALNVVSLVPSGFEAYARVFHPANLFTTDGTRNQDVRWAEVARMTGRTAHRMMQWHSLVGSFPDPDPDRVWDGGVRIQSPESGSLPEDVASLLVAVLRTHTATPERCWFALWDGWGGRGTPVTSAPTFTLPNRRYHLLTGPIQVTSRLTAYPNDPASLWWPTDHAWCVATEIDLDTTYIGGSRSCIDQLLTCEGIEAYEVEQTDRIDVYSDGLNPVPPGLANCSRRVNR
jgi:hypothetical protein